MNGTTLKLVLAVIEVLCLLDTASAQAVRVGHRYKVCEGGVCRAYMNSGSGTMIQDDGVNQWILTAGHTFRGEPGKPQYESLGAYCGVSQWRRCVLVAMTINDDIDLALLRTHGHQFAGDPETLHDPVSVPSGETVGIGGFGGGLEGKWVAQRGVLASATQVDVASRYGDSGGPVHYSGKLYGISRSSDLRQSTYFTPIALCWPFLRMHCPRYQSSPPPKPGAPKSPATRPDDRIDALTRQVAELQAKLESLTLQRGPAGKDAAPFTIRLRSQSKSDPTKWFNFGSVTITEPGEYTLDLPDTQIEWLRDGRLVSRQSFAAGKPIKLDTSTIQAGEVAE